MVRLAYGAPAAWDDPVWQLLSRGLASPAPDIRLSAALAAATTMWSGVAHHLERHLQGEDDPAVRDLIERSLVQLSRVQR